MATVMVEITNNDSKEYVEVFQEKEIRIPAGGTVVMPKSKANSFLASMAQDEKGRLKPKMLSSKPIGSQSGVSNTCTFCGKDFATPEALIEHSKTHAEHAFKDEELDKKLEEKGAMKCPICEFTCKTSDEMMDHFYGIHKKEEVKDDTKPGVRSSKGAGRRK